ncbi:MAG TPA: HYR domain-containing protein, partial [Chitinophagales bacterium]|nr:HYR domain-containing protein [Chitinophagales bacterium]
PTLTCPTPQTVTTTSNGTGDCTGSYTIPNPMADNCPGGTWSAAFSGNANGNPSAVGGIANGSPSSAITFQKGATTVILSATDTQGNNATTCSFTVTVNDNENPTLTCPTAQTITTSSNGTGDCTGGYSIPNPMADNCPGGTWGAAFSGNANGNPSTVSNIANGSASGTVTFQKGATTVILSATDAQGNNATTCSFTVTVNDNENPIVTCPTPQTIYTDNNGAGDCTAGYAMPNPMADNCTGGTWGVSFSGNPVSNPNAIANLPDGFNIEYIVLQKGNTTLTYTATDASGNAATPCSYTVTVIDNEAPMLYCSINQTVTTSSNGAGDCTGVYTIMNPLADNCPGATWGATFSGNANGMPANFSGIAEGSNSAALTIYRGVTNVTLSAVDAQGNPAATCNFTITLIDNEAPVFTCPTNQTVTTASNGAGDCTGGYAIPNTVLSDNCTGATWGATFSGNPNGIPAPLSGISAGSGSGILTFPIGATTATLTATDQQGNTASCSFTVTVNDNEAPGLTCPGNQTVYTAANPLPSCTGLYAIANPMSDNCTGGVWHAAFTNNANGLPNTVSNVPRGSGSGNIAFSLGATTVTLSATDAASNNAITCSFTVQVIDNRPPTITCPTNISVPSDPGICGAVVNFTVPFVLDDCSVAPNITAVPASGSIFSAGATTTVNVTAADAANNNANCSFTVTVTDTQAPVANCP